MDNKKNNASIMEKLTLPWLIVTIASMIAFLAFLIAMFFSFHTYLFFGIFLIIIAVAIIMDGIHKRKENYFSGNVNFIMSVLCIICAVILMLNDKALVNVFTNLFN
ncbi:MAG: hypothetical protein IJT03_00670 [Clostridia bacterium]|nr:hypothetical protein [Clostridia bacterium]